jgi:hypothetical protein
MVWFELDANTHFAISVGWFGLVFMNSSRGFSLGTTQFPNRCSFTCWALFTLLYKYFIFMRFP